MTRRRRGRPPKTKEQKVKDSADRTAPADYILARRKLFSFVSAPKGGEIDSQVCDAIGQLGALGLLDGHGIDPQEMVQKGRDWGCIYAKRMKVCAAKTAAFERRDRTTGQNLADTPEDLYFEKMDRNLPTHERNVLLSLLVDPLIGNGEKVYWAQALIDMELLKRKRLPTDRVMRFPDSSDEALLEAAIRGLCVLVDGALPSRWNRVAA